MNSQSTQLVLQNALTYDLQLQGFLNRVYRPNLYLVLLLKKLLSLQSHQALQLYENRQ